MSREMGDTPSAKDAAKLLGREGLNNCPACKSPAEIDKFMEFVSISCTRLKCTLSTNMKDTLEDAVQEWEERCELYPKLHPSDYRKL